MTGWNRPAVWRAVVAAASVGLIGLGFVHNSFRRGDTSWLIPLGVGADYALTDRLNLTGTFLLNVSDLDTGRGSGANAMPGLTVGVRF